MMTSYAAVADDNLNSVRPIYFQMSCKIEDASKRIKTLRQLAQESHFRSVSSVFMLKGDDCSILPNDALEEFKIRARAHLRIGECFASIQPEKVIGFVAEMANGEIFCVGLCIYPKTVNIAGKEILTRLDDKARWANFAKTVVFDHSNPENIKECLISHRCVYGILKQAEKDGILDVVVDPTMFWELNNFSLLGMTIRSAASSHASLADTSVH